MVKSGGKLNHKCHGTILGPDFARFCRTTIRRVSARPSSISKLRVWPILRVTRPIFLKKGFGFPKISFGKPKHKKNFTISFWKNDPRAFWKSNFRRWQSLYIDHISLDFQKFYLVTLTIKNISEKISKWPQKWLIKLFWYLKSIRCALICKWSAYGRARYD